MNIPVSHTDVETTACTCKMAFIYILSCGIYV